MPKINGRWRKLDKCTWYWEYADRYPPYRGHNPILCDGTITTNPPFIEKCIEGDPNAVRGPGYYAWRLGADDLDYTGPYKTLREAKDAALEGVDIA